MSRPSSKPGASRRIRGRSLERSTWKNTGEQHHRSLTSVTWGEAPSTNHQHPMKHQAPVKLRASSFKAARADAVLVFGRLKFQWSLVLGIWSLPERGLLHPISGGGVGVAGVRAASPG